MTGKVEQEDKPLGVKVMEMKNEAKAAGKELSYPGLEILKDIDGLFIKQEWEILEQLVSWYEQQNQYTVYDQDGKVQLFKAKEKTCCCWRLCCGENRGFNIKVYDTVGKKNKPAMVMKRHYRCCGWAVIPCCAHRVDVHYMVDEDGNTIGNTSSRTLMSTIQVPMCHGGCCQPTWNLNDRNGNHQGQITGPMCCVCDMCGADFSIADKNGKKMGSIRKLAPDSIKGLALELATEADTFKATFDKDLDPAIKLAIMAATLQIDFTFFEDNRGCGQCRCCDIYCCGYAAPCLPACMVCCCVSDPKDKKKAKDMKKGAPPSEEMLR